MVQWASKRIPGQDIDTFNGLPKNFAELENYENSMGQSIWNATFQNFLQLLHKTEVLGFDPLHDSVSDDDCLDPESPANLTREK